MKTKNRTFTISANQFPLTSKLQTIDSQTGFLPFLGKPKHDAYVLPLLAYNQPGSEIKIRD